jgi:hypothetical protein
MGQLVQKPAPHPLPITKEELEAHLKVFHEPTLNDVVHTYHVAMWDDPVYRRFLEAVYDEDAVEGSLTLDNGEAARMIRERAKAADDQRLGSKKLATISKALNVVLRRYGIGRKERAREVAGQIVDMSNGGAD